MNIFNLKITVQTHPRAGNCRQSTAMWKRRYSAGRQPGDGKTPPPEKNLGFNMILCVTITYLRRNRRWKSWAGAPLMNGTERLMAGVTKSSAFSFKSNSDEGVVFCCIWTAAAISLPPKAPHCFRKLGADIIWYWMNAPIDADYAS